MLENFEVETVAGPLYLNLHRANDYFVIVEIMGFNCFSTLLGNGESGLDAVPLLVSARLGWMPLLVEFFLIVNTSLEKFSVKYYHCIMCYSRILYWDPIKHVVCSAFELHIFLCRVKILSKILLFI